MTTTTYLSFDQDEPRTGRRPVEIPDGWRRVWRGAIKPSDRVSAAGNWRRPTADEIDYPEDAYERAVVIRQGGEGPDKPCQRCEARPAITGWKICAACRDVLREERKSAR